ncbi:hypothetical protein CEQ21_10040 [Niallia circulans]|uniref:Peptidase M10 metallopeptidase domain-containing protein n=1 Tax=Niallia circulans TaxID=1397 RepID=A0A553SG33_NIACI|nr:matrixin family metalloprotease [Niallia circulans]TRZ35952.1 hypothetical protein CEQ21_10040 [Niallia circulans]
MEISKKYVKITIIIFVCLLFLVPNNTNAYSTYNGHKMSSGIGNYGKSKKYFWVDSSASTYSTKINNAFDRWIDSTKYAGILTPTSYRKTTSKSASTIDFYAISSIANGVMGRARFMVNSTNVNANAQNWYWTRIEFSKSLMNNSSYSKYQQSVISHEIGHAFGLNHTNNQLMDSLVNEAPRQYPYKDEYNGINYLYK